MLGLIHFIRMFWRHSRIMLFIPSNSTHDLEQSHTVDMLMGIPFQILAPTLTRILKYPAQISRLITPPLKCNMKDFIGNSNINYNSYHKINFRFFEMADPDRWNIGIPFCLR